MTSFPGRRLPRRGGILGRHRRLLLNIWVLWYCFVLIERLADGATEPPVMDPDMLSPFEQSVFMQMLLLLGVRHAAGMSAVSATWHRHHPAARLPRVIALRWDVGDSVFRP